MEQISHTILHGHIYNSLDTKFLLALKFFTDVYNTSRINL